jgi:uncharacterized protein YbjT (DUF2867 family)
MYVIIGASGNTGSVIANKLLALGKKMRVVGRNAGHLASFATKGAEVFAGDVTDANAMTQAFAGAKAVYLMIPPKPDAPDFRLYQKQVQESLATALEKNGVKYAVTLSSIGADKAEKTGPIAGLHMFEERLNGIAGLNVLHLRAAYFMENTLGEADAIIQMGVAAGPIRPEVSFPMIAARDIGERAADALVNLDFKDHQIQELHGQRDISYGEITSILGKAIGKPDLSYVKLTDDQFRGALIQMGMSEDSAGLMVEMAGAFDSGYVKALDSRSSRNTTSTDFETFVKEQFLPVYRGKTAA